MNALNITVSTLAILVITACSTFSSAPEKNAAVESKSFDYKAPPAKVRALDVPPDLTSYTGDDRYSIPGGGESGTRYSDYSQGGASRKSSSVLPVVKNVRLERKDAQRWLVVNDKAENVWPIVKSFWEANGLVIKTENPQAGIIETDWAENRVKTPMAGLFSSGKRDQYHTRLDRSKDGSSTEIYIRHYSMQEAVEKDGTAKTNDPELEAIMLQLLMSKLGGGSGVLDSSKKPADALTASAASAPKLNKLADGSQSILLAEPFDKSWRKVGLALDQSGIVLADKDRSKGIYYLSAGKDDVKSKQGSDKIKRNQVNVRETASGCEVFVNNAAGSSNADTQKIIDTLFKALGRI